MTARLALIALLLTWPVAAGAETGFHPPRHGSAEQAEARRAYEDCLAQAASRIDDGQSDPGTVAGSMDGLCDEQQFRMATAVADGRRQSFLILNGLERHRADALEAVLRVRRTPLRRMVKPVSRR